LTYPGRIHAPARKALATAALASSLLVLSTPLARGQAIPWGAGCESLSPGAPRTSGTCGASLVDGRAVPPPGAPAAVRAVIAAANRIRRQPYVWGGGHLGFRSRGYDCSGAVGYALHGGELLETTMVSGQLAYWGEAGTGRWITVYANAEHVFMEVAGLRFDTRGDEPGERGPRWHMARADARVLRHFAARHPAGL
jgi:hypothetical protein